MDRFLANIRARAFLASAVAITVLSVAATSSPGSVAASSKQEVVSQRAASANDGGSSAFAAWLIYRSGERGDQALPRVLGQ